MPELRRQKRMDDRRVEYQRDHQVERFRMNASRQHLHYALTRFMISVGRERQRKRISTQIHGLLLR